MNGFMKDLHYAARSLLKSPGFTIVAALTLALGIGANTAIFSLVDAVLLRPLDFPDADRLVMIYEANLAKGWDRFTVAPANYLDWKSRSRSLAELGAFTGNNFNLTGRDDPERIRGAYVSAGLFPLLGVPAQLGRHILADEDRAGAEPVVVLTDALWRDRFGADQKILGRTLTLDGVSRTVVGVMPPAFRFLDAQVYVPLSWDAEAAGARGSHSYLVMGRLREGATAAQAQGEMNELASHLAGQYPDTNSGWGVLVSPLFEEVVGSGRKSLLILLGAAGFVLLTASANVANLLLVRAAARVKEVAIRTALGASRLRLVRQLLTESVLLSCIGGAAGLLVAMWGVDLVGSLGGLSLPRSKGAHLDGRVLLFTLGLSLATGIVFGLAPALRASRMTLNDALKEGGRDFAASRGRDRLKNAVVVSELSLALVLLIGAGLLIRTLGRLQSVDPGFRSENMLTLKVSLPGSRYPDEARQSAFFHTLLEKLESLPGVRSAAATSSLPMGGDRIFAFFIDGRPALAPGDVPSANHYAVSPGYFRAMGIPLVAGREFTGRDREGAPRVALINRTMARRFFADADPIGQRLRIGNAGATPLEIVGVVGDVKHYGLSAEATPQMYEPYLQQPFGAMSLVVRGDAPLGMAALVRKEVSAIDPEQPVFDVSTMDAILARSLAPQRSYTMLLGVFAALALTLASIGIYGVMAYSVSQRTREIGIRMALGARHADVMKLVVGHGLRLMVAGLGIGLVLAFALTRLLRTMLFEVSPVDLPTYAGLSLLLAGVTLLACYLPARRAAGVDPMVALKHN